MHREFVYVGDPVPELNEQEHAAFLMNIQKSILLSLEKRKLRIGEKKMMKCGLEAEIVAYRRSEDMDVRFPDGVVVKNVQYANFKRGMVGHP